MFIEKFSLMFLMGGMLKLILGRFFHKRPPTNFGRRLAAMLRLLTFFLMLASSAGTVLSDAFQIGPIYERMLKNDILSIEISPVVGNLWINYSSPGSRGIEVHLYSNRTIGAYNFSAVYVIPKSEGVYEMMIEFNSNFSWNCVVGVYSSNYTFYGKYPMLTSSGPFIHLLSFGINSKNQTDRGFSYKIYIVLNVESFEREISIFPSFRFPAPVNAFIFILTNLFLAYVNVFFILDTYFKSRVSEVSKSRLAIICLMILVSLFISYQIYFLMKGES